MKGVRRLLEQTGALVSRDRSGQHIAVVGGGSPVAGQVGKFSDRSLMENTGQKFPLLFKILVFLICQPQTVGYFGLECHQAFRKRHGLLDLTGKVVQIPFRVGNGKAAGNF